MHRVSDIFKAYPLRSGLRLFAFGLLFAHLLFVSIPRCQLISEWIGSSFLAAEESKTPMSCHEQTAEPTKGPRLQSDHACRCLLLSFVPMHHQLFDPKPFVGFRVQSIRVLNFAFSQSISDYARAPDPPYPKSLALA